MLPAILDPRNDVGPESVLGIRVEGGGKAFSD